MPTNRSSVFPILMVVLGGVLMIGALLWFVFATRQSVPAVSQLATPVVVSNSSSISSITPVASPAIPYPEIKRISIGDAKAAFELKSAVFIDVRGDPYYSEGHIPEAISMTQEEMATRMGELDKNAWIITYCT